MLIRVLKMLSSSWTKVAPKPIFQLSSCIDKSIVSDFPNFQKDASLLVFGIFPVQLGYYL
jgi:hypothetical protein